MQIHIPQPCPADWSTMQIGAIGRHCQQCQKTVVDFTRMSREEIILYLLQHHNQKTCGRFKQSQLDFYKLEEVFTSRQLRAMPYNKAITLLSLACMVLASCQNIEPIDFPKPPTESIVHDSLPNKPLPDHAAADSATITSSTVAKPSPKPIEIIETGEVVIMGDLIDFSPISEDTADQFIMRELPEFAEPDSLNVGSTICTFTEIMPEFPRGMDSLFVFIARNFTYPPTCATYTGKIYVQFVVEKDGSLSNIEVVRSPEHFDEMNREVLRVFGLMPNWKPGQNRGKPERVQMVVPISLKME